MLEMTDQTVKQLALSRNHENAGDEKVAYMSIAYTEVDLTEAQIDALMGKFTYRSWFNINGADIQPMDWTKKVDLGCTDKFKDVSVTMRLGKKELEFDGCRLYVDEFKLLSGGMVRADIHLHVLEAKDSEWNLVGQNEFCEVKLSLGDGVLIERKGRKQRELPLEGGEDVGGSEEPTSTTTPLTGAHIANAAGDQTHIWWQHGISGDQSNGPRCNKPEGCVEIDPPQGGKSEREQIEADAKARGTENDSEEFAEGVAKALGAHKKRGSVTDGRSERVKHQDEKRGAH